MGREVRYPGPLRPAHPRVIWAAKRRILGSLLFNSVTAEEVGEVAIWWFGDLSLWPGEPPLAPWPVLLSGQVSGSA